MYTKKIMNDLPIGFHPVPRTGRSNSYNSSTQSKDYLKTKQIIATNKDKMQPKRVIKHEVTGPEMRKRQLTPLKGFKPRKLRDRRKKDGTPYIVPKVEAPVKIAEQS